MKKWLGILLMMVSGFAMASKDNVLFLQSATTGTLVKNPDNTYTITLKDFPSYIGYFTDRPERKAGIMTIGEFINFWKNKAIKNNFSEVPPNVAFVIKPPVGQPQNFIAEVLEPVYANNTLAYKVKVIGSKPTYTGKFVHLNAFFDDIPWNPGGF